MKALARDAVKAPEMALRLVPEVPDAGDVVPVVCKGPGVVDADMMERRRVQRIAGVEAFGIDDAVRLDPLLDDRKKRCRAWLYASF